MKGATAVLPNLTHPLPDMIDEDHSYVSPIDIFAHHYAFGLKTDNVVDSKNTSKVNTLTQSLWSGRMYINAKELYSMRNFPLSVDVTPSMCWSDKAEIHKQKSNRKSSVWVKTMTIQPPKELDNSAVNTYVVSLGSHDGNRQKVEDQFQCDIKKLSNGTLLPFYEWSRKRMVYLHSEIVCDIRDIPERVEGLFVGSGNGTYTKIFRHSVNFNAKNYFTTT